MEKKNKVLINGKEFDCPSQEQIDEFLKDDEFSIEYEDIEVAEDVYVDHEYHITGEELINFIFEETKEFQNCTMEYEIEEPELDDLNVFVFCKADELFDKYYDKLKKYYEDFAEDEAWENYDPDEDRYYFDSSDKADR